MTERREGPEGGGDVEQALDLLTEAVANKFDSMLTLDWDVINSSPDHPLHEVTAWREQLENEPDMERHIAEVQELQAQLDAATTDEERMMILKAIKNAWKATSAALNTIALLHSVWKTIKTATGSVDIEAGLEIIMVL